MRAIPLPHGGAGRLPGEGAFGLLDHPLDHDPADIAVLAGGKGTQVAVVIDPQLVGHFILEVLQGLSRFSDQDTIVSPRHVFFHLLSLNAVIV